MQTADKDKTLSDVVVREFNSWWYDYRIKNQLSDTPHKREIALEAWKISHILAQQEGYRMGLEEVLKEAQQRSKERERAESAEAALREQKKLSEAISRDCNDIGSALTQAEGFLREVVQEGRGYDDEQFNGMVKRIQTYLDSRKGGK